VFDTWEKQFVDEIIDLPEVGSLAFAKTLFDRLKRNAIICTSGDGKTGEKFISLKFLGHTEFFSTGMVSLSRISGATILPIFCIHKRNSKRCLVIEQPIAVARESNRECTLKNSVAQYAALLERYIRRYPEQYRNWHLVSDDSELTH
jgi:lauroyl/myristoyl acyltransferase